ncbi:MAG: sigma-70 family RNA polymerase sigma factor [Methylococcaceae bacterium]|nr:sigma-70 family RNA polymerase sigma factor [Methylococcaceae bacterium]
MNTASEGEGEVDAWSDSEPAGEEAVTASFDTVPETGPLEEVLLQSLIERIADHDEPALAELYDRLAGRVYGLALRITRRVPMAEEAAQDVFWQVWRQAPRFDAGRGSALAWGMTIARSRALDALRRVDPEECELEPETLEMQQAPDGVGPPDLLSALQQGQTLHAALARRDPVPRQLLSLAFFRGLSHDEIALHAGLPLGTVKSHIRRALASLKELLVPTDYEVKLP